ncbi:ABC transporter substrate-binding protein [Microbacterium karelineae]|uniref:ABC transporter substrate-binding protein n=1 Tax=Microbacterium karelineae TaxID=2654283 RepID=UPI0012E9EC88|nr:ABC transporter substrate-binding protein [Microbacterium karelineae]
MIRHTRAAGATAAVLGVALAASACAGQAPAPTVADTSSDAFSKDLTLDEIVERAQDEDPITIYDGTSKVEEMAEAFGEAYGLKATGVKADASEVIEKTTREAQSGNIVGDVVTIKDLPALKSQLVPSGFVTTWVPSDLAPSIDESMRDPLVLITDPSIFAYNSEVHDTCPVDNVWQLTEPEWRGEVATEDPVGSSAKLDWFSQLAQFGDDELRAAYEAEFGEELETELDSAAAEWVARLAANEPILTKSSEEASEAVGALGQDDPPVGLVASAKFRNIDEKGYALATCDELDPWAGFASPKAIAIASGTDSPYSAMLYVHYALTQEGIAPQIADGKISSNADVVQPEDPAHIGDLVDELFFFDNAGLDADWADREVWQDLWRTSSR